MTAEGGARDGEWYKADLVGLAEAAVGYLTTVEGSGENGLEDDVNSKKRKSSMVSKIQILDKSTQLLYKVLMAQGCASVTCK